MQEQALTDAIVANAAELSKCRRRFLSHVLLSSLSINHRIDFLCPAARPIYCNRVQSVEVDKSILSPYRPIFDAYRRREFELAVTTDILQEYEDIFRQKMTSEIANNLLELIDRQPTQFLHKCITAGT